MRNKAGEVLVSIGYEAVNPTPILVGGSKEITITDKDILLMQVPNVKEQGYYAGMTAIKSYLKESCPELKLFCLDPITPYFDENEHLKNSEFILDFNTYTNQGNFLELKKYKEMKYIVKCAIQEIKKYNPLWVGFSIIDGNIDSTLYIAKCIKEKFPKINIVLGGQGTSLLNGGIMRSKRFHEDGRFKDELGRSFTFNYDYDDWDFIDYIVYGDGEMKFKNLLLIKKTKEELNKIGGIAFRYNNKWYINEETVNLSLAEMPIPDYSDFIGTETYDRQYGATVPLILSRGCPFKCTFCTIPTVVPNFNYRKVESCIQEIQQWYDKGHRSFFIHDSIINFRPDWLKEFCEKILEKPWQHGIHNLDAIHWGGNTRLMSPLRDIDTMRLYNKAGFWQMITGLESGSRKVLRHMKKYPNVHGIREIFDNIRQINAEAAETNTYPIRVMLQLIIGYINESEEDFQMTMDLVRDYSDIVHQVTTCSLFLCWEPLMETWLKEGNWIHFKNEVEWETEFSTLEQRLDRAKRIEKLFIELGLEYNIYLRESISSNFDKQHQGDLEKSNQERMKEFS